MNICMVPQGKNLQKIPSICRVSEFPSALTDVSENFSNLLGHYTYEET
jgi:hypothetical protein